MNVKIKVPTSLKDIKLSQYQKFLRTTKDNEDAEFINRQLVGIFCNLTDDLVFSMARKDFVNIVNDLSKVLQETPEVQTKFVYNGIKYGLIPSMEEMTVGEQADLDTIYSDYQKRDKVMAILYRPIKLESRGSYLIEDYTGKEEPLDLSMDIIMGADVFFCNIVKDCMSITLNYIKGAEIQAKILPILEKSGIGIKTFTQSLEETFLSLKEQLN
jgi:hypothetical protein